MSDQIMELVATACAGDVVFIRLSAAMPDDFGAIEAAGEAMAAKGAALICLAPDVDISIGDTALAHLNAENSRLRRALEDVAGRDLVDQVISEVTA
jgi:hypothetical protein